MLDGTPVLELTRVGKSFGGLVAVQDVSLSVWKGEIYGLIGPNGAGKTTLFNIVTGIYRPTSGRVRYCGRDITGIKPYSAAALGIARTFQNIRLFGQLSVFQNVLVPMQIRAGYSVGEALTRLGRFWREERALHRRAAELLELVGLTNRAHMRASELPYGEQRKVEIARALAVQPQLLLLDEPAAGMNPEESLQLSDFIVDVKAKFDLTVVVIEHHMEVVMEICDRLMVLNFGRTIAEGAPEDIRSHKAVIEAYLGTEWGTQPC